MKMEKQRYLEQQYIIKWNAGEHFMLLLFVWMAFQVFAEMLASHTHTHSATAQWNHTVVWWGEWGCRYEHLNRGNGRERKRAVHSIFINHELTHSKICTEFLIPWRNGRIPSTSKLSACEMIEWRWGWLRLASTARTHILKVSNNNNALAVCCNILSKTKTKKATHIPHDFSFSLGPYAAHFIYSL